MQALQAQVSQWQLMYDACGQPAWAKPWGDYLQQEIRNTSRFLPRWVVPAVGWRMRAW